AQVKMPPLLRSLQRREATAFSTYLLGQMTNSMVLGADGKPLGQTVEVDKSRVDATGARIVRGLFYLESKRSLSSQEELRVASKAGVAAEAPAVQQFARMYSASADRRSREVGEAFSYATAFFPTFSIWFLLLYGYFSWLATIKSVQAMNR